MMGKLPLFNASKQGFHVFRTQQVERGRGAVLAIVGVGVHLPFVKPVHLSAAPAPDLFGAECCAMLPSLANLSPRRVLWRLRRR
jgi:hypothetical protein